LAGPKDLDVDPLSLAPEHATEVVEVQPALLGGRSSAALLKAGSGQDKEDVVKGPWRQALGSVGADDVDLDVFLVGADSEPQRELADEGAAGDLASGGEGSGFGGPVVGGRQIEDLPPLGLDAELDQIAESQGLFDSDLYASLAYPRPVAAAEIPDVPAVPVPEDGRVLAGDARIAEHQARTGRPPDDDPRGGDEGESSAQVFEGGHGGTVPPAGVDSWPMDAGPRRYRLLGRLGEGGFGVVYRARLEGPQGFSKDVAIKLLRDAEAPERTIARFRDEARILGMLRDRAIVGVDPPTRIDGQWALVMDFVDGVSCAELLRSGPIPAGAALEIIGEVARALDVAWSQPGPDGDPLQLLHRDLKPPNIQITPTGVVKILDFGVARARFDREARTTRHLSGTPAYMAPERLQGIEEPSGDIYSLGVVLHELVTGSCPGEAGAVADTFEIERDSEVAPVDDVVSFARQMRGPRASRPSAREVEEGCRELGAKVVGPSLRAWSEENVPAAPPAINDEQVGRVLTESATAIRSSGIPIVVTISLALAAGLFAALWMFVSAEVPTLEDALRQPFADLVMEHNAHLSERSALRATQNWDARLFDATVAHVAEMQDDATAWHRIDQIWEVWRDVTGVVRAAGLPEVIAGIPWLESRYTPELQSTMCAKGLWQFMPETAQSVGLRVADCRFADDPEVLWTPEAGAPMDFPYVAGGTCRIPKRHGCAVDERTMIEESTAAAVAGLARAWEDPRFRESGAVVQLTVAAHNVGFPGLASCLDKDACDIHALTEGGDYVARVFAAHFVAVCYYAANYPEEPAFTRWRKYTEGYCRSIDVPTRAEVARGDRN